MKCVPNASLFVVFLAASLTGYAQQPKPLTMSGVVTDQRDHKPIQGASVTVIGNQANPDTTDNDGVFELSLPEALKEVRIRIEKTGYKTYDKRVPVSSSIPLQISLEVIAPAKGNPVKPPAGATPSITRTDSFATLVPFHAEWRNVPIPMNTNPSDPHEEFYSGLLNLAGRPDKQPEGWPTYRERRFESGDEQFHFVTRLLRYYVFRSIYFSERGVIGGMKWTAGIGVTPINKKPVVPPESVPYAAENILGLLPDNEFLRPEDEMLWKNKPLKVPLGTRVSFIERENPEKGEVFTCALRFEKPTYFRIDFEVQPGIAMNNQLPAGFVSEAVQGTTTYSMTVSIKYEVERKDDHGFKPDQYAAWADALYEGLKREMSFDAVPLASQPQIALESSFAVNGSAEITDYPADTVLGTIPWRNDYAHLQLNLTNQEPDDLSDVDLVIGTNESIAAIAQKTNFPDIVLFPPVVDPFISASVTTVDKDGHQVTVPAVSSGITTAAQYRIRCSKIYSRSTVQFTIALVTVNLTPGVELHSPYSPKKLPTWMDVKGSYKIGQTLFNVNRHLEFRSNTPATP
jgi:hypothetical protein